MKKVVIVILILILQIIQTPVSSAQTPGPNNGWSFNYDKNNNKITQKPRSSAAEGVEGTFVYENPEKLSAGLLKKAMTGMNATTMHRNLVDLINNMPAEEGLLAFSLNSFPKAYLVVSFKTNKTLGLYYKSGSADKYFFNWLYVNNYNSANELKWYDIAQETTWNPYDDTKVIQDANEKIKKLVLLMNGEYRGELVFSNYGGKRYGWQQNVSDLLSGYIDNLKICGTATMDFSQSKFWDSLPENDKTLAPKTEKKWPKDFLVAGFSRMAITSKIPVYLQYVFSDGVYVTATSNKLVNGYAVIDVDNGKWEIDMKDLPTGKYKLLSEFFLRKNEGGKARPDTPVSGGFSDWLDNRNKTQDNIEVFMNSPLEFEVVKNADDSFAISDASLNTSLTGPGCSYNLDMQPKDLWDAGRMNATTDSACDKIEEGSSFVKTVKKGICAVLVEVKSWADDFFRWSQKWLTASLGVKDPNAPLEIDEETIEDVKVETNTTTGGSSGSTPAATSLPTEPTGAAIPTSIARVSLNFGSDTVAYQKLKDNASSVNGRFTYQPGTSYKDAKLAFPSTPVEQFDDTNHKVKLSVYNSENMPTGTTSVLITLFIGSSDVIATFTVPKNEFNKEGYVNTNINR